MIRLAAFFWIVLALGCARAANTDARLILSHDSAKPGETILAGIQMKMAPGWHTYWQNGGDSGMPTTIDWTLPKGVTAGEIQWPLPEKYVMEGETTFVYHNDVVLLVPLSLATDAPSEKVTVKAKVAWLECEKLCVLGRGEVTASLTISAESKPSKDAALFDTWKSRLPQTKPEIDVRAGWEADAKGDSRPLLIEWTADTKAKSADFFPYSDEKFIVKPASEQLKNAGIRVRVRKSVEKLETWPAQIAGVLIERGDGGKLLGAYEVKLPVQASISARANGAAKKSLIGQMALAFLGGLILNLMPCVLPVLALKVFGFVQQSHGSPGRAKAFGLVYGVGVIVSLLVLAGILIGVKAAGGDASWGALQYQNPQFLIAVTTLVTLVALNLFGVFEVTLASGAMTKASQVASGEGLAGAFFNGVLAVILATPCTAPVMAGAIGWAIPQKAGVILLIFAMVGLGLALPYVVLSFAPGLVRLLPKPGPWMEKFKIAMGFPMLATAVWLLSLTVFHYDDAGILWGGLFLVFVALAAWVWGQFVQRSSGHPKLAIGVALALLVGGYVFALEFELKWRKPATLESSVGVPTRVSGDISWQPWTPSTVEKARAEGRPILVDFTAKWCLTCKVNAQTSIDIPSVRKRLEQINAVPLLGDYTRKNPLIAAELKRFERAGVPLVLVYPKDAAKPPIVLPELLTPSIVLDALEKAVN